jgi:hypothetical protein
MGDRLRLRPFKANHPFYELARDVGRGLGRLGLRS